MTRKVHADSATMEVPQVSLVGYRVKEIVILRFEDDS